ncbi:unnamed protein product [Parnassius mnemosyne]|uniref:DDE Tnp4 domain-containing protein n=1 Tax=Parnassius mnemosyne TaxID=213953 RepID=A0AAV1M9D8_9NEOP
MDYLQYFDIFDEIDREEPPRKRKFYKKRFDPFTLEEKDFRMKYRFSKVYMRKIVKLVQRDIELQASGGGLSVELQVCTALRTWARQEVQDDAADIHGLSQQSITNICRRVALALASKAAQFICMPSTLEEQEQVVSGFKNICGFKQVIGAIDCTHIKIKKFGGDSAQYYINRKGFSSLNVQVVCDAQLKIRDIVAHWRGSTHDARIFRESQIRQRFENGEFHGRLLGDSGYGLTNYLFTPVQNPRTAKEKSYNKSHILTRNTIERCFGVWKQRFRCLLLGFSVSLENVKLYIVALAILHNIAIEMNEGIDFLEPVISEDNGDQQVLREGLDSRSGQETRRLFIETQF